jgi:predicted Co/Zn/Cd cation transporter (cation efflux family)
MPYSKASQRAVDKYSKQNYDSYLFRVPKGKKQEIKEYADRNNITVNELTAHALEKETGIEGLALDKNRTIDETIAKDGE